MSSQGPNDKGQNSLHRTSTLLSQKNEPLSFAEKLRQIKQLIRQNVAEDKSAQLEQHLEELHQIYNADISKDKGSKQRLQQQREVVSSQKQGKRSEKVILEVIQGKRIKNDIKIEGEARGPRSPQKKVEEKRFVKFEPKKAANDNHSSLVGIRKTSPNK